MPYLADTFNFGQYLKEKVPNELLVALTEMYEAIAVEVNAKPDVVFRTSNPASTDVNFRQGTIWINQSTNKVYQLTSKAGAPPAATWSLLN